MVALGNPQKQTNPTNPQKPRKVFPFPSNTPKPIPERILIEFETHLRKVLPAKPPSNFGKFAKTLSSSVHFYEFTLSCFLAFSRVDQQVLPVLLDLRACLVILLLFHYETQTLTQ